MADTLSESDLIGHGEFASIFAFGSNRVVKLYRTEGDAAWQQRLPDYHAEELRAYTLSGSDPIRLGRQLRVDPTALAEWVGRGGKALPGGWRRDG